jgi:GNAT superfamily N-acetyltransferase
VPLEVRPASIVSDEATELITALNAELSAAYPEPGATHFRLDPNEVAPGKGAFFVALLDSEPVGCGAVRLLDGGADAEIKRMYTAPSARGRGVARAILAAIESEARRLGARRLVLETGTRQTSALALYRREGFVEIDAFGEYVASPGTSVCMARAL